MPQLPYLASPGNVPKAIAAIQSAATPERVTQDFVKTVLKIPGSSGDQMTTFLRRLNFVGSGGKPTELYRKLRNPSTSGQAVAQAITAAYTELYRHNEYMHELSDDQLKGLIMEVTGNAADSRPVNLTLSTLTNQKEFADFSPVMESNAFEESVSTIDAVRAHEDRFQRPPEPLRQQLGLNLGYTINLNLPATSDIEVFNAIFKSLRENLLRDE